MNLKAGDTLRAEFLVTSDTVLVDADAMPAVLLSRNGLDDPGAPVTVAALAEGRYLASVDIPSAYALGDDIRLLASAAVGGIETSSYIFAGRLEDPIGTILGTYVTGTAGGALQRLGAAQVGLLSPAISAAGDLDIIAGDDYLAVDARAIDWSDEGGTWPSLIGATMEYRMLGFSKPVDIIVADGPTKRLRLELSAAETGAMAAGRRPYDLKATLAGGSVITLANGQITVSAMP
jgi:hypothetical protein